MLGLLRLLGNIKELPLGGRIDPECISGAYR